MNFTLGFISHYFLINLIITSLVFRGASKYFNKNSDWFGVFRYSMVFLFAGLPLLLLDFLKKV